MDVPTLGNYFLDNCNYMDSFKLIKLPTIFPLPYGMTAIKGSDDTLHNISDMKGPLWSKLILSWPKPFADAVNASPNAANLLPVLEKDQQWAENTLIQSESLTNDKEEDWDIIKVITDALNHLHATNTAAPTASLVVVSTMPNNKSVLKLNSAPKEESFSTLCCLSGGHP